MALTLETNPVGRSCEQSPSTQDDPLISRIKKDCERKEEFLKNQTYPAYLSSPPKDIDSGPYGIASLANTMPPPRSEPPPLKQGEQYSAT